MAALDSRGRPAEWEGSGRHTLRGAATAETADHQIHGAHKRRRGGRQQLTGPNPQQFTDGNWREGAASLAGLVEQGTPAQRALARQLLGQIESQQLQNVQLANTARIQQISGAVTSSTEGVVGGLNTVVMDGLAALFRQPAHTDAVRTIANERQAELQDMTQAISAVQQVNRQTGLTLYELGRVAPEELDATLGKAYPELSPVDITRLRGNVVKALANPDVGAVSRANYSSFSWDRGLAQADTSFADTFLAATSKAIGSTVRQARSDAEAFKSSPSLATAFAAHLSADLLDDFSAAPRFLNSSIQTAQTYWAEVGGVSGAVGGALTKAADFALPALTAPLTVVDYRATDEERNRALIDTALFYAGGALIKAGLPGLQAFVDSQPTSGEGLSGRRGPGDSVQCRPFGTRRRLGERGGRVPSVSQRSQPDAGEDPT